MNKTTDTRGETSRVSELQARFADIAATQMADMPLNHEAIAAETVAFRPHDDGFLGVLIVPWAMNLLYLPKTYQAQSHPVGSKVNHTIGEEILEFIHAFDDAIGAYQMCSLESPIESCNNQDEARLIAQAIMDKLMTATTETPKPRPDSVSRRAFLTGKPR